MSTLLPPATAGNPSSADLSEMAADNMAAFEHVARYPGLVNKPDLFLIDLIADPPKMMADVDEVTAAAAIIIAARLDGRLPFVP